MAASLSSPSSRPRWRSWTRRPGTATKHRRHRGRLALTAAFGLLVTERHVAGTDVFEVPATRELAALTRVPIVSALVCGLCCLLLFAGSAWGAYAGRIAAVLSAAMVAEQVARSLATLFVPSRQGKKPA